MDKKKYYAMTKTQRIEILRDISKFIVENDILSFGGLFNHENFNSEWSYVIGKNHYFLDKYFTSKRFSKRNKRQGDLKK